MRVWGAAGGEQRVFERRVSQPRDGWSRDERETQNGEKEVHRDRSGCEGRNMVHSWRPSGSNPPANRGPDRPWNLEKSVCGYWWCGHWIRPKPTLAACHQKRVALAPRTEVYTVRYPRGSNVGLSPFGIEGGHLPIPLPTPGPIVYFPCGCTAAAQVKEPDE
ncbi:hypothetical protein VTI28DRAFT_2914 [Corynascus sepedonium]